MNIFHITWHENGKNRYGAVSFKEDGHDVDTLHLYAYNEGAFLSRIGITHDGGTVYEAMYPASVDEAREELVDLAVSFFEGYTMQEYESEPQDAEIISIEAFQEQ